MQKVFYIQKTGANGDEHIPTTNRFERIEKLNLLLNSGWRIGNFVCQDGDEYFLLEKDDDARISRVM